MKKFEDIFTSTIISISVKIRTFNVYIASIFLYNTELWSVTPTMETQIDSFQRRILRYALGIKWPKVMSTNRLYELTKAEQWSKTIKRRRLTFLGHIMRLPRDTPIKESIGTLF